MWVPSFLWAKRKLMGNAGYIRLASNEWLSTFMDEEKPGAQPLGYGRIPLRSFPCGLQGLWLDGSQVLCAMVLSFLATIQTSPWVSFYCKRQQKTQHAYRLCTWSSGIFLETLTTLGKPFLGSSWSGSLSHRGDLDLVWGHHPHKWVQEWAQLAVLSEAVPVAGWLCHVSALAKIIFLQL